MKKLDLPGELLQVKNLREKAESLIKDWEGMELVVSQHRSKLQNAVSWLEKIEQDMKGDLR